MHGQEPLNPIILLILSSDLKGTDCFPAVTLHSLCIPLRWQVKTWSVLTLRALTSALVSSTHNMAVNSFNLWQISECFRSKMAPYPEAQALPFWASSPHSEASLHPCRPLRSIPTPARLLLLGPLQPIFLSLHFNPVCFIALYTSHTWGWILFFLEIWQQMSLTLNVSLSTFTTTVGIISFLLSVCVIPVFLSFFQAAPLSPSYRTANAFCNFLYPFPLTITSTGFFFSFLSQSKSYPRWVFQPFYLGA